MDTMKGRNMIRIKGSKIKKPVYPLYDWSNRIIVVNRQTVVVTYPDEDKKLEGR